MPESLLEGRRELSIGEGFDEQGYRRSGPVSPTIQLFRLRGDEDDRQIGELVGNLVRKIVSAHPRHVDVEDQAVGAGESILRQKLLRRRELP